MIPTAYQVANVLEEVAHYTRLSFSELAIYCNITEARIRKIRREPVILEWQTVKDIRAGCRHAIHKHLDPFSPFTPVEGLEREWIELNRGIRVYLFALSDQLKVSPPKSRRQRLRHLRDDEDYDIKKFNRRTYREQDSRSQEADGGKDARLPPNHGPSRQP